MIGGAKFDEVKLDDFIFKLADKYPDCTIVTGSGQGAERRIKALAEGLGLHVDVPEPNLKIYADPLGCQVFDVLIGADVIVLTSTGSRPKAAEDWWKRVYGHLKTSDPLYRPLHSLVTASKTAKAPPKRVRSKSQRHAAESLDNVQKTA